MRTFLHGNCSLEDVKELEKSPLIEEHELAKAGFALLSQRVGYDVPEVDLELLKSGTVPLFKRGFFPWQSLPYPREHAELGWILSQLPQYRHIAEKMVSFQQATFDHNGWPIHSLFMQEKGCPYNLLLDVNRKFFEELKVEVPKEYRFEDLELGIVADRSDESTRIVLGSGCKSGMGVYLYHDVGFKNYGPQLLPLDDCSGFGLAGRARNFQLKNRHSISYQCRMSAPHYRNTGFAGLKDSGYSGLWIETEADMSPDSLELRCHFESLRSMHALAFSFFAKGDACYVSEFQKLNPRSLDRYEGPAQQITLKSKDKSVGLEPQDGLSKMEIIPLAGDESYWGADFLIAFFFESPSICFKFYHA